MALSVFMKPAGNWPTTPVTKDPIFYGYISGQWRPVKAIFVKRKATANSAATWQKVFEHVQTEVRNVRGASIESKNAATLAWDPPAGTIPKVGYEYQVRYSTEGSTTVQNYGGWQNGESKALSGLQLDTLYYFTVTVRRRSGNMTETTSAPAIRLRTGVNGTLRTNGTTPVKVTVTPSKGDTWSKDANWKAGGDNADIIQGYKTEAAKNGRGVVRYNTLYAQVAAKLDLPVAEISKPVNNIAAHTIVNTAKVVRVLRRGGGAASPTVNVHACNINFGSSDAPVPVTFADAPDTGTFQAPAPGDTKTDFTIMDRSGANPPVAGGPRDVLTTWAQDWLNQEKKHDGLLIVRTDGAGNNEVGHNGWCTFRGAEVDWRLELDVKWSYKYPADSEAKWNP